MTGDTAVTVNPAAALGLRLRQRTSEATPRRTPASRASKPVTQHLDAMSARLQGLAGKGHTPCLPFVLVSALVLFAIVVAVLPTVWRAVQGSCGGDSAALQVASLCT